MLVFPERDVFLVLRVVGIEMGGELEDWKYREFRTPKMQTSTDPQKCGHPKSM